MNNLTQEAGGCGSFEDGEDWSGGEGAGECVGYGAEAEEDGGVGGELSDSGEGGSGRGG